MATWRLQTPELHLAERKTTRKHGLGFFPSGQVREMGKFLKMFVYGNVGLWLAYGCLNGLGCHIKIAQCVNSGQSLIGWILQTLLTRGGTDLPCFRLQLPGLVNVYQKLMGKIRHV